MSLAGKVKGKAARNVETPPGSAIRVGVGHGERTSTRCRETHDTPKGYTLRCVEPAWHHVPSVYLGTKATQHRDKEGNRW